jgi:hypothetical protein
MTQPTPEQVNAAQGTRLSNKAPWETYGASLDQNLTPEMAAAVAEYASHTHDDSSNESKEELARWKEGNAEVAKEYQWCTPEEYADIQMRFGRIMHSSELINKLRNECKLKCWYRQHPQSDKLTLLIDPTNGLQQPEVGCWVQNGYMPEYTIMGFDDHGVPLAEKYRGWRTVLLQLILKGSLTEEIAHKVFGKAVLPCSERYNSILHGWRNREEK